MTATWILRVNCVTCGRCRRRGPWFAEGHWLEITLEEQPDGATTHKYRRRIEVLCSPSCAAWFACRIDGPVFDKHGVELRPWLELWRQHQRTRAGAAV